MNAEQAKQEVRAMIAMTRAIIETVLETGDQGTPRGPLYAAMMTRGIDLQTYERLETLALNSGVIKRKGDLLFPAK